jgi:hypothetical protein
MNNLFDDRLNYLLREILNTDEETDDEKEQNDKNESCELCSNYYDHDEHSNFFLSCCASNYCIKCVSSMCQKQEKCPKCHSSFEETNILTNILTNMLQKQSSIKDKNIEECFLCCEKLNVSQYNGEVFLQCPCNLKICITCAYRSLTDTKHVKIGEVQGIPGLILPHNYVVKGCCPTCRQVPLNKDEIIMLYGFLPPRL